VPSNVTAAVGVTCRTKGKLETLKDNIMDSALQPEGSKKLRRRREKMITFTWREN
jgi:hypothetical protein